jgi:hypothetical protein
MTEVTIPAWLFWTALPLAIIGVGAVGAAAHALISNPDEDY